MRSLAEFFGLKKVDFWDAPLEQYAHVIIDVQKHYCSYEMTKIKKAEQISQHIAKITPAFRAASIKTFIIYMDHFDRGIDHVNGGLHNLTSDPSDILVAKSRNSAFIKNKTDGLLKKHGISHLLVSGFNTGYCVKETIMDGLKHRYKIAALKDAIGSGNQNDRPKFLDLHDMKEAGALITTSNAALRHLQAK